MLPPRALEYSAGAGYIWLSRLMFCVTSHSPYRFQISGRSILGERQSILLTTLRWVSFALNESKATFVRRLVRGWWTLE